MNDSKLKKKLRGIGFIPPSKKDKDFWGIYKTLQELMASSLDEKTNLKAAFFAVRIEDETTTKEEASMGIFAIGEDIIYYSAVFPKIEKMGWMTFEILKLENISFEGIPNKVWDGLNFEYEEKKYCFGALSGKLPTNFIREILSIRVFL